MTTRSPADDILEIQRLYVDYGRHLDDGDHAAFAALFAKQGKARIHIRADGPAEIEAALRSAAADGASRRGLHLIGMPRIDVDGDTAHGDAMWVFISPGVDGKQVVTSVGRHVDDFVREDGVWKFAVRRGFIDLPAS